MLKPFTKFTQKIYSLTCQRMIGLIRERREKLQETNHPLTCQRVNFCVDFMNGFSIAFIYNGKTPIDPTPNTRLGFNNLSSNNISQVERRNRESLNWSIKTNKQKIKTKHNCL